MLTVKQADAAKPQEKPYRVLDGNGLYLYVPVSGKKVWQLRYFIEGREKVLTIGKCAMMTLQEAREKAFIARKEVSMGIDPNAKKKNVEADDSFSTMFKEWFDHKKQVWSFGYSKELEGMFEEEILPMIGDIKISEIDPPMLIKVIRRFEDRGAMERANKARRRCNEVFKYAIVNGWAKYNPAADLAGAMKGYRRQNYPFLPIHEIPGFNKALKGYDGSIISKYATQFLQYTALRTIEMRSLLWTDIDFESKLITINPEVMKMRKVHIVPMSMQVESILKDLQSITGMYQHVFAGRTDKSKPISNNSVLGVIRRIGYDGRASGHGFRHQFSTILNEHEFNRDAIEAQLAHTSGSGTRAVYNHAQYFKLRQEMMQWWADFIDGKV